MIHFSKCARLDGDCKLSNVVVVRSPLRRYGVKIQPYICHRFCEIKSCRIIRSRRRFDLGDRWYSSEKRVCTSRIIIAIYIITPTISILRAFRRGRWWTAISRLLLWYWRCQRNQLSLTPILPGEYVMFHPISWQRNISCDVILWPIILFVICVHFSF